MMSMDHLALAATLDLFRFRLPMIPLMWGKSIWPVIYEA